MNDLKVGISAVTAYVPPYRVDLQKWCSWSEKSWEKINHVIGSGFRILGPNQSIYTMAANAVLKLIESYNICLLYTSPSPRDLSTSRMPSSA